jgi:hypothetical protein
VIDLSEEVADLWQEVGNVRHEVAGLSEEVADLWQEVADLRRQKILVLGVGP